MLLLPPWQVGLFQLLCHSSAPGGLVPQLCGVVVLGPTVLTDVAAQVGEDSSGSSLTRMGPFGVKFAHITWVLKVWMLRPTCLTESLSVLACVLERLIQRILQLREWGQLDAFRSVHCGVCRDQVCGNKEVEGRDEALRSHSKLHGNISWSLLAPVSAWCHGWLEWVEGWFLASCCSSRCHLSWKFWIWDLWTHLQTLSQFQMF